MTIRYRPKLAWITVQDNVTQENTTTTTVLLTKEEETRRDAELSVAARNESIAATCIEAVADLVSVPEQNTQQTAILAADFLF